MGRCASRCKMIILSQNVRPATTVGTTGSHSFNCGNALATNDVIKRSSHGLHEPGIPASSFIGELCSNVYGYRIDNT